MNFYKESLFQLLGQAPTKPGPDDFTPEVKQIHFYKRGEKVTLEEIRAEHAAHRSHKWRNRRWLTLIAVNLLFLVSYYFDIQLLEGALTASRFIGFHMADLNAALQVMLAFKHVVLNLLIGTVTIFIMWFLLGGRTFCSWVCPYHLVAEWAEKLHLWLVARKLIKSYEFHRGVRTVFYAVFALAALLSGYTVFETVSPTGILSRAIIYGATLALGWVAFLLLFEIFVSQRAWCRYVCPIGMTYGVVGLFSPLHVAYNVESCKHEGECRKVCEVPHVLDPVIKGRAVDVNVPIGADCTRCGLCIDTCPTGSLRYEFRGLKKIL